jgi:hypothetical protein
MQRAAVTVALSTRAGCFWMEAIASGGFCDKTKEISEKRIEMRLSSFSQVLTQKNPLQ